jgi:cardiolipin synthase A/B
MLASSLCSAQTSDSLIVNQLRGKGVSFSHDNSVTLLMNGQEKFDDMFQAIRQCISCHSPTTFVPFI